MRYPNNNLEKKLFKNGYQYIAGIDEVGRGAWAGPLVAVAVITDIKFPLSKFKKLRIRDSKLLSERVRENIFHEISKKFIWSAGLVTQKEIDDQGLTWANHQAVIRAIDSLPLMPDYLLLDKIFGFEHQLPHELIVKGDQKIISISLASILAKVTRDRLMKKYHQQYPNYKFTKHKGYGTKLHLKSLKKHGICPLHRQSFQPIQQFL